MINPPGSLVEMKYYFWIFDGVRCRRRGFTPGEFSRQEKRLLQDGPKKEAKSGILKIMPDWTAKQRQRADATVFTVIWI